MTALIVRYGILAGLIVAIPMVGQVLIRGALVESMLLGYAVMIVALTAVFLGIKQYRDKQLGGVIRFLPALGLGLGISIVACVLYVIGWEISLALMDFDFAKYYSNAMIEAAKARNATPAEMQQAIASAESFSALYANPVFRMLITFVEMFPVGVLISLISAAVLRNSRVLPAR